MHHENKLEVIDRVSATAVTKEGYSKLPWLILCAAQSVRDWESAVLALGIKNRVSVKYQQVYQLEIWLEQQPEPHLVIVDEYDPGLLPIMRGLLPKLNEQNHRLFMTRVDTVKPNPMLVHETLDFMRK